MIKQYFLRRNHCLINFTFSCICFGNGASNACQTKTAKLHAKRKRNNETAVKECIHQKIKTNSIIS